ncbi:uncharacterized protein K460DRAFT_361809 [Cucurbitaria berberidis CBS 394.84]|uniref:Uncharacterized protein n=1 Tax=Cucurbitaria berberidis CBS 394.84 TaxID=1168544 RepID=A0A9P4LEG0_9PLEO|nr:uncharacterized protein K460DRAFT_361809 [Cucurbitaria berberidis CBS 394.84]KAF1851059.1 hypothetical protein K460DRAFT_361809 [Cucurbitaria berberidis CBS 394.84]
MAAAPITSAQLGQDVINRLVNSPTNPSNCTCGWYIYYSNVCGHPYQDVPHRCGRTTVPTGKSGFCKSPAPRHIVQAPQVAAQCRLC